jgi:hypothetical protein
MDISPKATAGILQEVTEAFNSFLPFGVFTDSAHLVKKKNLGRYFLISKSMCIGFLFVY